MIFLGQITQKDLDFWKDCEAFGEEQRRNAHRNSLELQIEQHKDEYNLLTEKYLQACIDRTVAQEAEQSAKIDASFMKYTIREGKKQLKAADKERSNWRKQFFLLLAFVVMVPMVIAFLLSRPRTVQPASRFDKRSTGEKVWLRSQ